MVPQTRREFFADVGKGMLVATVGAGVAADLGLAPAFADAGAERLSFGPLEPLVALMQETRPDQLLPRVVEKLNGGTELGRVVAAAALANARTFGGEDYIGFHTLMALSPSYRMAGEMPADRRPLPVLKVLYRNANRIQERGGRKDEVLHPVKPAAAAGDRPAGEALREQVRRRDLAAAEGTFAASAAKSPEEAFNDLLITVQDATEVHRVVLPYRAWDLLDLVGKEHAHTLLRQSVRFCVKGEPTYAPQFASCRATLPKMLDQYRNDSDDDGYAEHEHPVRAIRPSEFPAFIFLEMLALANRSQRLLRRGT